MVYGISKLFLLKKTKYIFVLLCFALCFYDDKIIEQETVSSCCARMQY
jgi:hypothetical protein